jgi:hypothetical protein
MFTFGHRSRDDALWRLGDNNNKQWLEKEGATGWVFVQARSSRGVEEVRFAQSPDLPFTLPARCLTDVHEPPNRSPAKLNCAAACEGDDAEDSGGCAEMAMVMTVDTERGSLGRFKGDVDVRQSRTRRRQLRTRS